MTIDNRFQVLHPRTVLWFEQREKCAQCVYCKKGETEMRCTQAASKNVGRAQFNYCIDMREPDSLCGPDAHFFHPRYTKD